MYFFIKHWDPQWKSSSEDHCTPFRRGLKLIIVGLIIGLSYNNLLMPIIFKELSEDHT